MRAQQSASSGAEVLAEREMAAICVGILADTHGILNPRLLTAFRDAKVEAIVHAGDICQHKSRLSLEEILSRLEAIAPVTAVRGNMEDKHCKGHKLPNTAVLCKRNARLHIHHGDLIDYKDPQKVMSALRPSDGWRSDDVIIYGHSHKAELTRRNGVLFFNPSAATLPRFNNAPTGNRCALLRINGDELSFYSVDFSREGEPALVTPIPVEEEQAGSSRPSPKTSNKRQRTVAPVMAATAADDEDCKLLGTIEALFIKETRGAPMASCETLGVQMGLGIEGDVHASPHTPRQILLHCDDGATEAGAMRENMRLRLETGVSWPPSSGSVLRIGKAGAALRISFACEPCKNGAAYAGVELHDLSKSWKARASRGMLATALRSGQVSAGDEVWLLAGERYAPLGDEHPQRVRQILSKVPEGKVLPWTLLAQLAGAPTGFSMRGMPGLLRAAYDKELPAWRVVDSKWRCPRNGKGELHLSDQIGRLQGEGCKLSDDGEVVDRESVGWSPEHAELYWTGRTDGRTGRVVAS